jgi:hypothetical protein
MGESGRNSRPRLLTHGREARRRRSSGTAAFAVLAFLVPAYIELLPHSRWEPLTLLAALAAIASISYFGAVALKAATAFDGAFVAALVALVFLGPLPAACVWIVSEIGAFAVQRRRPDAFLVNAASFAAAALAGGAILAVLTGAAPLEGSPGLADAGAIALTGVAMLLANFFVGAFLISVLRGRPLSDVVQTELFALAPAALAMVLAGTTAVLLYDALGVLALGLFSLVVMVPQMLLPRLLKPRPVHELGHSEAVALYAQAIGRALGFPRSDRLVLKDAACYMRERQLRPRDGDLSNFSDEHRVALVEAVLFHREHWDSADGFPGAVGGEMIPLLSRVLAVADAWAGLTARESPRLDHQQALNQLEARAGLHFDPRIVTAAADVVASDNLALGTGVAYQPTAHRTPVTRRALQLGSRLARSTT